MNNDSLASLPEEYQKIVLDTFAEVEKELADQTRKDSDESYVKAEADGVKVIPYEEIDVESFKQALSGIVDEYSNLAPDLYDIITKLADPDATNGQQERYSIDNCWYNDLPLVTYEKGGLIEEEATGGFTPSDMVNLDAISA